MPIRARLAQPHDPLKLSHRLRKADREEILAATGMSPIQVLVDSYELSSPCYTIVNEDEEVVGMFGVTPSSTPDVGVVWMLATDLLVKYRQQFLRMSHGWMKHLHEKYPILWNFVDKRNGVHIKWLKWIGVNFVMEHKEWGAEKRPFLEFVHV